MYLTVLAALSCIAAVESRIIAGAVIPHGDFAFDCTLINCTNGSLSLHTEALQLGAELAALAPDLIILSTPHGLALERDFLFYENSEASGFANIGEDMPPNSGFQSYDATLNATLDPNVTSGLLAALAGHNVTGLSAFANSEPMALRWGEVVPLSFLNATLLPYGGKSRVVIVSQPLRRYTEAATMREELLGKLRAGGRLCMRLPQAARALRSSPSYLALRTLVS